MSEMTDLSNNIEANDWIHSVSFASESDTHEFVSYASIVNKTHQQRLAIINDWVAASETFSHKHFCPNTVNQIVIENAYWKVEVPTSADSQYESVILPKIQCKKLSVLSYAQRTSLAALLGRLATRYDNLLMTSLDFEICWCQTSGSDVGLFARYKPTNIKRVEAPIFGSNKNQQLTAQKLASRLNSLSDIHFEDVAFIRYRGHGCPGPTESEGYLV